MYNVSFAVILALASFLPVTAGELLGNFRLDTFITPVGTAADNHGNLFVAGNTTTWLKDSVGNHIGTSPVFVVSRWLRGSSQPQHIRTLRFPQCTGAALAMDASEAVWFLARCSGVGTVLRRYHRDGNLIGGINLDVDSRSVPTQSHLSGAIAADADGNLFVAGIVIPTSSDDATPPALFVLKLRSEDGRHVPAVLYRTALEGFVKDDQVKAITVDRDGSVWVAGTTSSRAFPHTPDAWISSRTGETDGFALKLNPESSLVYSTLIGGSDRDSVTGLALDGGGAVLIAGGTRSTDFPIVGNASLAPGTTNSFLLRLAPDGQPRYSGYLTGDAYALSADAVGRTILSRSNRPCDGCLASASVVSEIDPSTASIIDDYQIPQASGPQFLASAPDGAIVLLCSAGVVGNLLSNLPSLQIVNFSRPLEGWVTTNKSRHSLGTIPSVFIFR